MKLIPLCLGAGLWLSTAAAAEPEPPSVELLLYLAEWAADPDGRLVDPMDLADDDPGDTSISTKTQATTPATRERP